MFHDSIVCLEQSGMDAPVVSSDVLPLSEDGIQTIRLSPDHRPILLRSKAKSDIRHVGAGVEGIHPDELVHDRTVCYSKYC